MATSALPSRGGRRGQKYYVNPALSCFPNAKRRETIRSGYLTPAFLGAQNMVELLLNPCILGGPLQQAPGDNQKWLPHPCLVGGPEDGIIAT